ncbi:MAG: PAS domain-containing protein [Rhodomicrobium sp.]
MHGAAFGGRFVHKVSGEFRFRLVGTAIARQFGHDLTGHIVGSQVSNAPEAIPALQAIGERVLASAHPVFSTGQHETGLGTFHQVSVLLLPLSDDEEHACTIIFTRIACFSSDVSASRDWLAGAPFRLGEAVDVKDEADLARRCLDWQRNCFSSTNMEIERSMPVGGSSARR